MFIYIGQIIHAPPALVLTCFLVKLIPVTIHRVLALVGTNAVIVVVLVKVQTIAARVVKHAVQNDGNTPVLGFFAQQRKVLQISQ